MCACCRHPLFPLLALLFEKCEQSTMSAECITSASFDVDIENFVRCQEKEGKPFFSDDPELDNLVRLLQGAPAAFFSVLSDTKHRCETFDMWMTFDLSNTATSSHTLIRIQ